MAALGSVGNVVGGIALNKHLAMRPIPFWLQVLTVASTTAFLAIDVSGSIGGTVERDGSPVAGARVFLFYRTQTDFFLIAQTFSAADGTYSFDPASWPYVGLNKSSNKYFVMALDPQNAYNAKIYDLVTPV